MFSIKARIKLRALECIMKSILSFIFLFNVICLSVKAEQACYLAKDSLGAHYRLIKGLSGSQLTTESLKTLWRSKHKVLSVNGQQSVTWFKLENGFVQKTAHFDHYMRSIEYQAKAMAEERWQQIWQFVPNSKRHSLTLIDRKKIGCWQQEVYQWKDEEKESAGELIWNASLNLVSSLTIKQGKQQSQWQLEKIEMDKNVIAQAFSKRDNYQSTDFADIGDNESDPFLIKMINLGFIEHGASGFYNTQGENMSSTHHH